MSFNWFVAGFNISSMLHAMAAGQDGWAAANAVFAITNVLVAFSKRRG